MFLMDTGEKEFILPQAPTMEKTGRQPKAELLSQLYNRIKGCQKCPLGATRTNLVFGAGNPNASVMFIGEAPGYEEDKTGIPFVGRAGKLLDKILAAMKLSREDVYIANILKCRPPNNRDPLQLEVAKCLPYLEQQIEIISPDIICCLGRISALYLLRLKLPMKLMRGNIYHWKGSIPVIVTYHPAAILRNPSLKRPLWEDMQRIMKILKEGV